MLRRCPNVRLQYKSGNDYNTICGTKSYENQHKKLIQVSSRLAHRGNWGQAIARQGIANPIGTVWCASMMLDHLGHAEAAADMITAIENLLNNKQRRLSFGNAGRKLAEEHFDINGVVDKHLCIYKSEA